MPSTDTYTLSLHDALPISSGRSGSGNSCPAGRYSFAFNETSDPLPPGMSFVISSATVAKSAARSRVTRSTLPPVPLSVSSGSQDRKSTRLNSSHEWISYAVHRYLHSFPTRRSSDLQRQVGQREQLPGREVQLRLQRDERPLAARHVLRHLVGDGREIRGQVQGHEVHVAARALERLERLARSEEHTSELQSRVDLVCRPPIPTLFPYTTLFRSPAAGRAAGTAARPGGTASPSTRRATPCRPACPSSSRRRRSRNPRPGPGSRGPRCRPCP